ncbi:MAG: hypothetical protein K2O41_04755 [Clostridia bacterium]|nr:hypothetical protein [Clostridia bacterium]
MEDKEREVKALGFDALINGLYFIIVLISFIISVTLYTDNNYRASYATCFILVVPCLLDGIKDFVSVQIRKKWLSRIDALVTGLMVGIAVVLLVLIFGDYHISILGEILIGLSSISFLRYGLTSGFLIFEIIKKKKSKEE